MCRYNGSMLVSGKAFLGLIRHIREAEGADAVARVVEKADNPYVRTVFAETIRPLSWYHYSAFASFLQSCADTLGNGDVTYCRTLGRGAGKRDLNSVFKLILRLRDPERLITACSRVWDSYYREAGHMQAVETRPQHTVLRIYDFKKMHPAHCQLMIGWMIEAMLLIGCKVHDDAHEAKCMCRGDAYHEFVCSWSKVA